MKKLYLLIYNDDVGTRTEVKTILNKMTTVLLWRYDIPHCFYITSNNSAKELHEEFITANGKKGRFMFIECTDNRQGLMLKDTWFFLNNKKAAPKP
ncbi:hypothetical protein [Pseudomonas atacamensis]|uniref:hypothetical protein n=1 Tax=Pseudomonas atacamensis TaxID=2565368 RepID=UPI00300EEDBC